MPLVTEDGVDECLWFHNMRSRIRDGRDLESGEHDVRRESHILRRYRLNSVVVIRRVTVGVGGNPGPPLVSESITGEF